MLIQRMFRCFADIPEESLSLPAQDLVIGSPSLTWTSYGSSLGAEIPEYLLIGSSSTGASHVPEDSLIGSYEVPEDLLIEILLRIPAEFVTRFRSLSKFYQELIDSPDFRRKHTHLSLKRQACSSHIILGQTSSRCNEIDHQVMKLDSAKLDAKFKRLINSVLKDEGYSIVGCCVGILCLSYPPKARKNGHMLLWNPFTGSWSPRIPVKRWDSKYFFFFGHDASTDDFKILKLGHFSGNYDFEIYSSRIGSWRKIAISDNYKNLPKLYMLSSGTFVEGTNSVHIELCDLPGRRYITAFDFSSDKFKRIPLPENRHPYPLGLSSLDGCLCVYTKWGFSERSVWVMKEYGVEKSWTCVCSLPDHSLGNLYLSPLKLVNDGRQLLVLSTHCYKYEYGVQAFDLEEKNSTEGEKISSLMEPTTPITTALKQFLYAPSLREFN